MSNAIDITLDDLTGTQKEMAEVLGLEKYLELCRRFGGSSPYIPMFEEVIKPVRNRHMQDDFDGSIRDVARKYGISERHVYNIVPKRLRIAMKNKPIADQVKWF